jgi:hypothetical protein
MKYRRRRGEVPAFGGGVVEQNDVAVGLEIAVAFRSVPWPLISLRTTKPSTGRPCQLRAHTAPSPADLTRGSIFFARSFLEEDGCPGQARA